METLTKYGFDPTRSAVRIARAADLETAEWLYLNDFACGTWEQVLAGAADRLGMDADDLDADDLASLVTVLEVQDVPSRFREDGAVSDDFLTLLWLLDLGELDEDDIPRFLHWCDYTGHTDDVARDFEAWQEADCGKYDSLGEWLRDNFCDLEPEVYAALDERNLLHYFDFDGYAYADYRFDYSELDGHVYCDNV